MFKTYEEISFLPRRKIETLMEFKILLKEYGKIDHTWYVFDLSEIKDDLTKNDLEKLSIVAYKYKAGRLYNKDIVYEDLLDKDSREYKYTLDWKNIHYYNSIIGEKTYPL